MTKQTIIQGYKVEIEGTDCFVSRGKFCSSLAAMHATGTLEDSNFEESHEVPEKAQNAITAWAEKNGW